MAADPTSHGVGLYIGGAIGAALAAALGPQWLEVLATGGAAVLGAMAQVSRRRTPGGTAAALRIIVLWSGAALVCTGMLVWTLGHSIGVQAPAAVLYPCSAFGLAAVGDVALIKLRRWVRGYGEEGER